MWVCASPIAAVPSGQAKPTARCGNAMPLMMSGFWLARLILACHRPRPASKLSMPKSSRKLVISVAPTLLAVSKHGRGEKNVRPFTSSVVFAGRQAAHDSCLACQFGAGHDGDITRYAAPLAAEHRSLRSPSAGSTRGVPVFGKCQTWPSQPVVVGGAGSRDPCPCARDAERPRHRSWSTQHAKSSAADRNKVLRLRRSGDVILHDLLECVEPKRLSSLNENVAWRILLLRTRSLKKGAFKSGSFEPR